jgi:hypothetical protein
MVPQMLVKLRQGLQRIDYPEDRIPPFFDGLISIHEQAFEAGRVATTEGGTTPALVPRVDATELQVSNDDGLWMADDEVTDSGFMRDLYVSLGEPLNDARTEWSMRVYYKPFVPWLWGGVLLMVFGGVLASLDRRYRK